MDDDSISLVLARASELRSKITNCIHNSSSTDTVADGREGEDKEDDDEESLLNIRDALESLEAQLSSLQALQQQQSYEKEAFLAEIDFSRKRLLQKLKEYKGDDLEVIREATAFASSTVEIENADLLLPPYPSRASRSLASESHFPFTQKISENGVTANHSANELKGGGINQSDRRGSIKGWRGIVGAAAKAVITLVGFVAVLSLSGFETRIGRSESKVRGTTQEHQGNEDKREMITGCPPGKVLVVEDGETRCLVKERVETPFVSIATTPDVSYGCG